MLTALSAVSTSQYIQIPNRSFLKTHGRGYLPRVYMPAGKSVHSACVPGSHLLTGKSPGIFSLQFPSLPACLARLPPDPNHLPGLRHVTRKGLCPEALHTLDRHCPFG